MSTPTALRYARRHPVWVAVAVFALLVALLFDWNWFRGPLERYISNKTQRTFRISDLHVTLGLAPTIRLRDLYFSNAPWGRDEPVARIGMLEFSVSLRDIFAEKILIPRMALTDADVLMERSKDGERNWRIVEPGDRRPGRFRISTLAVDRGRLRYFNHAEPFELSIVAETFDPAVGKDVEDAAARPSNRRYSTRYAISGKYHDAAFSGNALAGDTLSFQESGLPFPLKGRLVAGTTRLEVEGTVADVVRVSAIDVALKIQGQTLANLYPFLRLPLPASPPYLLQGRLGMAGNRYRLDGLHGQIGSTDIAGEASYVNREPRPLLVANLQSRVLDLADLGPMIGIESPSGRKPALTQAQTRTRPAAKEQRAATDGKLLPAGTFEAERLQAIDAEVRLDARRLKAPTALPFESLQASLQLHDGVLKLAPLDVGFAGGVIAAAVTLDARQQVLASDARIDFRRIRLDRLLPETGKDAKTAGTLGGRIQLQGRGNSIAALAATSDGTVSAAISGGRISNLLDAAIGLNGGKVLSLMIGGDRNIAIRCGAAAFDVKNGQGSSRFFVVDTEQTQVVGGGVFDLGRETFDLTVEPRPKKKGLFSLRTPVRLHGTFRNPDYELNKGPLIARAAGAVALAAISPLAALLPLIETGPGTQTDCGKMLAEVPGARSQASPPGPR